MKLKRRERKRDKSEKSRKGRRIGLTGLLIILVVLFGIFGGLVGFITDYLWFKELGYVSVFFKQKYKELKFVGHFIHS